MYNFEDEQTCGSTFAMGHVDPQNVLNISLSDFNNPFNRYTVLLSGKDVIVQWLQNVGLLAKTMICHRCNVPCSRNVRQKNLDGFVWRCTARHEISIRRYSFFSHSHLHLADIIQFLISYAEGQSLWKCAQYAGVNYGSTAVDWGSFCRDLFVEYYVCNIRHTQFSGEIEMDESLFGRRTKYHRGRPQGLKV